MHRAGRLRLYVDDALENMAAIVALALCAVVARHKVQHKRNYQSYTAVTGITILPHVRQRQRGFRGLSHLCVSRPDHQAQQYSSSTSPTPHSRQQPATQTSTKHVYRGSSAAGGVWCIESRAMARCARILFTMAMVLSLLPCLALKATTSVAESGVSYSLISDPFGMAAGGYMQFDVTPTSDEVVRCVCVCVCMPLCACFVFRRSGPGRVLALVRVYN